MSEWPENYPSCCPPDDSDDASGTLYHLVKHEFGRVKQTGRPGHHSFWIREQYLQNIHNEFEVVE